MSGRALERGVSETKLASALNVNVEVIRHRRQLLDGISPDVEDLLKDRVVGTLRAGVPLNEWLTRYVD